MTADLYLASLATIAVFFASPPGPSQALMISNSLRLGLRRALPTIGGDLSANAIQMTLAGFGLTAVIAGSGLLLGIVKWAGIAYLVYVAVRTWVSRVDPLAHAPQGRLSSPAAQGFVTSMANPKAILFFGALFPQFIDPGSPIAPQLLILGATYLVVDGILLLAWGAAAGGMRQWLATSGRLINRLSGGMMLLAAAMLAGRSVEPTSR